MNNSNSNSNSNLTQTRNKSSMESSCRPQAPVIPFVSLIRRLQIQSQVSTRCLFLRNRPLLPPSPEGTSPHEQYCTCQPLSFHIMNLSSFCLTAQVAENSKSLRVPPELVQALRHLLQVLPSSRYDSDAKTKSTRDRATSAHKRNMQPCFPCRVARKAVRLAFSQLDIYVSYGLP